MLSNAFLDELDTELVDLQTKAENDKLKKLDPAHVAEIAVDARAVIAELRSMQETKNVA